jgi:hypothetical protein
MRLRNINFGVSLILVLLLLRCLFIVYTTGRYADHKTPRIAEFDIIIHGDTIRQYGNTVRLPTNYYYHIGYNKKHDTFYFVGYSDFKDGGNDTLTLTRPIQKTN